MLDSKKRQTLKLIGAAPLVSLPFSASAAGLPATLTANSIDAVQTNVPDLPAPAPRAGMELQIQIIDTVAVPDNNVLFRNHTDETLIVSQFLPGHIVYDGKLVDLNAAVGSEQLILHAGQSKAFEFKVWSLVNAGPVEYVWAEHVVEALSEDTSIVTLGAFMADNNAVVYANTKQYIPS